ncbi:amidohydrolase family protein [Rhodobacter sp. 24-YEA-8]|uniref:amidohydrolase family protein n=1 Tax=Rhodobacter sp. 24-YEA-8 TaxID=1884310 RepID=UPI00089C24F7|nr:amidohydrolase family protein [Rhodobacter sp. 24-YEA-8]SED47856.1 hypothetical protein SAMN05519105_4084 [Rhodobacter sp. 24-YEA-8]
MARVRSDAFGRELNPELAMRISGGRPWEAVPDDLFVIDGVAHTYHYGEDNWVPGGYGKMASDGVWGIHKYFSPEGEKWLLPESEHAMQTADLLAHSLFAESDIDACVYHALPLFPIFRDGGGPIETGKEMRDRWPGRVALYAAISPYRPDALEAIDQLIEEDKVTAFKFYPTDLVDGKVRGVRLDDEELMFPLYERMLKHGLTTVAMHKAIPFTPQAHEFFGMNDILGATTSFPALNFEIFHGGFAFLEDTVMKASYAPNMTINLEGSSALILRAPERLAHILGALMQAGAADRIVWGTGVPVVHPQPFLEAFWNFQIPDSLQEGYGYDPITDEAKRMMLGGTQARIAGLDVAAMAAEASGDEFDRMNGLSTPWSKARQVVSHE